MKASRLRKKVLNWFRSECTKQFYYRFTGKDARLLSHNFMYLIHSLKTTTDSHQSNLMLLSLAYCCLKLCDVLSMFSHVNVERGVLVELKCSCQHFFNAVSLLLGNVTPTVWTIGYAVLRH